MTYDINGSLPRYLSNDLKTIQRRAMLIIYPSKSNGDAMVSAGLTHLLQRRQ